MFVITYTNGGVRRVHPEIYPTIGQAITARRLLPFGQSPAAAPIIMTLASISSEVYEEALETVRFEQAQAEKAHKAESDAQKGV